MVWLLRRPYFNSCRVGFMVVLCSNIYIYDKAFCTRRNILWKNILLSDISAISDLYIHLYTDTISDLNIYIYILCKQVRITPSCSPSNLDIYSGISSAASMHRGGSAINDVGREVQE